MTPSDFSVLLLAWDEADPGVVVLGGGALPPTRQLLRHLAAEQPVLAVYPHLPAEDDAPAVAVELLPAPDEAAPAPAAATEPADSGPALPSVAAPPRATPPALTLVPGVRLLAQAQSATEQYAGLQSGAPASRVIGLDELMPATPAAAAPLGGWAAVQQPRPLVVRRPQWPAGAGTGATPAGVWRAPAAPYIGASVGAPSWHWLPGPFPPPPGPGPESPASVVADAPASDQLLPPTTPSLRPPAHPQAGDLNFDPDPELPTMQRPAAFSETVEEIGAAEASDLFAPEDDLVPDAPLQPTPPAAPAPTPVSAAPNARTAPLAMAAPAPPGFTLAGLNGRMIRYARRAAQLMHGRTDFGVIYAPNWPAWLAALEIRDRSGRPLVLYAANLAADYAAPAERGWLLEVERMALRRAHLILVPDADLSFRLRTRYGTAIGEVRVVSQHDEAAVQQALFQAAGQ